MSKSRRVQKRMPSETITRNKADSTLIKSDQTFLAFVSHPKFVAMVKALLTILVILVSIRTFYILFTVNEESISLINLLASLVTIIVALKPEILQRPFEALSNKLFGSLLSSNTYSIILLVVILILTICFRWVLFDRLGEDKVEKALSITEIKEINQALENLGHAKDLGKTSEDIVKRLSIALHNTIAFTILENNTKARALAGLIAEYAKTEPMNNYIDDLTKSLEEEIDKKIADAKDTNFFLAIECLITVNSSNANYSAYFSRLAEKYNENALEVLRDSSEERAKAKMNLEAVQEFDKVGNRDNSARSTSLYTLAQVKEELNASEDINEVIALYNEAITLDAQNLIAYYDLSAHLVIKHEEEKSDVTKLDEAIKIADKGLAQIGNTQFSSTKICEGMQNIADQTIGERAYICFLLMTIRGVAGIDKYRNDSNTDYKSYQIAIEILEAAITYAEANNHFLEVDPKLSTAEPYYYYALTQENPELDIFCKIIKYIGEPTPKNRERHEKWKKFAIPKLIGRACP